MNGFLASLMYMYSKLLLLYPRDFRDEFGEEMGVVFRDSLDDAARQGLGSLILVFFRELIGLAINILLEFWDENQSKELIIVPEGNSSSLASAGKEMTMKLFRFVLAILGMSLICVAAGWGWTSTQLDKARTQGVYSSPEAGMLGWAEKVYSADREVKIMSAGPNSLRGYQPQVWYVIAEIHASTRYDGSKLGANGCDAPGLFFVETKEGWVYMPEGAFPEIVGFWMKLFGWAGQGQVTPSTDLLPHGIYRFCNGSEGVYYGN
jgi:hypothetical protein